MAIGVGIRYGLGRLQGEMAAAKPPAEQQPAGEEPIIVARETRLGTPTGLGSNDRPGRLDVIWPDGERRVVDTPTPNAVLVLDHPSTLVRR